VELVLDQQTLRDLEVFETRNGERSLFTLLDRARTRGGAAALRRRFLHPHADYASILAVQSSVRYALEHPAVFSNIPSQFVVSGFDHYFHWHISPPVKDRGLARISEMIQLRVDNSREFQQISMGVANTLSIIRSMQALVDQTSNDVVAGELGALLAEMRGLLDRRAFKELPVKPLEDWAFWTIFNVDGRLRGERKALLRIVQLLFEIDSIVAMARGTQEHGFVLPEVVDGPPLFEAERLFHPFLGAQIRNGVCLNAQRRLLFLTGPNMAGKTTYLRSCGVALYLAHVGMGVPAARLRFAPCDAFFTSITLSDDIRDGISFFQAEALRARSVAEAVAGGLRVVALMDEPFKGTNVKDALDASCAFFSRLAGKENCLFLVASHLIEAADVLLETGHVDCRHFEATEIGGELHFDYVLHEGVSGQRLGMRVLEQHGVFELLDASLPGMAAD